ncbi:MAG: hypothetical protein WKF40_10925 [Thermoleophilaceae bacterium]
MARDDRRRYVVSCSWTRTKDPVQVQQGPEQRLERGRGGSSREALER